VSCWLERELIEKGERVQTRGGKKERKGERRRGFKRVWVTDIVLSLKSTSDQEGAELEVESRGETKNTPALSIASLTEVTLSFSCNCNTSDRPLSQHCPPSLYYPPSL